MNACPTVLLAIGLAVAIPTFGVARADAGAGTDTGNGTPKAGCFFDENYLAERLSELAASEVDESKRRYIESLIDAVSANWREERDLMARMSPVPVRFPGS